MGSPMLPNFDDIATKLLELEESIANKATQVFDGAFKRVLAQLFVLWPGDNATPEAKQRALSKIDFDVLLAAVPKAQTEIISGAFEAIGLGIEAGLLQAKAANVELEPFKQQLPSDLLASVEGIHRSSQARIVQARGLLREALTIQDAVTAVSLAHPRPTVQQVARTVTNQASNKGLNVVAEASPELVQIWKAERDACVHCLAYQGYQRVMGSYPGGLTFGKAALRKERVPEPPLHHNCRCTQIIVHRESARDIKVGLLREAQRSVLRGWSVKSESESVRIDAARRLLAKHPAMPKSVQAYARSAIAKGAFARGRNFPGAR